MTTCLCVMTATDCTVMRCLYCVYCLCCLLEWSKACWARARWIWWWTSQWDCTSTWHRHLALAAQQCTG